ncbi:hypothetical protein GCM10023217_34630 [Gordonia alkaliphila]|uniref:DUF2690 domain-containing protein n=1 Tax=Gordonia alkaliphila TaxID=1053547 RepID=A0ABP8ZKJ3_9ACTN
MKGDYANMRSTSTRRAKAAGAAIFAAAALAAVVPSGTAHADSSGSNGCAYIYLSGRPSGFKVTAQRTNQYCNFTGHLQVTGPNGLNRNSPTSNSPSQRFVVTGKGSGKVCVTAWKKSGNTHTLNGRACNNVF